jgi:single-strand DNA-binding protein
MLTAFGMARIGRDAELRSTPAGDSVIQLSLAFNVFVKKEKVTQWVEAAIWGTRAESLAPYLLKGKAVSVVLENLHAETFNKADGTPSTKLVARIAEIDLAPSGDGQKSTSAPAPAPAPRPAQQRPAPQKSAPTGFDDMDDDIPF